MSLPRWDDLQLLLTVVRSGSALAAARELGMSQSTISRRMAALETQLDMRLFDRRARRLEPTAAALELLQVADRFDDNLSDLVTRLRGREHEMAGPVRVSSVRPIMRAVLPCLKDIRQTRPEIEFVLESNASVSNLHKKESDIVMRVTDSPPETLTGRRVAKFAYALYRSVAEPGVGDLIGYPPPRGDLRKADWLSDVVPDATVVMRVGDDELQHDAVLAGLGAAQLICLDADRDTRLERVPGAPLEFGWDLWVLTHPDLKEMPRVRVVFDAIVAALVDQRDLIEGRRPLSRTPLSSDA